MTAYLPPQNPTDKDVARALKEVDIRAKRIRKAFQEAGVTLTGSQMVHAMRDSDYAVAGTDMGR